MFREFIRTKTPFGRPLYANASYIWVSGVVRSVLGFAFWLVAARLYSKEAIGGAGTVISTAMLVGTLSILGFREGIIRFLKEADNPSSLINTSFFFVALASSLVTLVLLAGIRWWLPALSVILLTDDLLIVAFVGLSVGYILFEILQSVFIALYAAHNNVKLVLVAGVLKISLIFVVRLIFQDTLSLLIAYGGALLLVFFVAVTIWLPRYLPGYRIGLKGVSLESIRPMIKFSLGNYLSNLLWMTPSRLYPLLVMNTLGEIAAADFYIAWLLGGVLEMTSGSLATSLFAEGARASRQVYRDARRTFWGSLLVTGLSAAGLFIFARPILLLFGTEYSYEAMGLVRFFCIAVFLNVVTITYRGVARANSWIDRLIAISVVRAILALVAGVSLSAVYGLHGIGIAWVGVQFVISGLVTILILRRIGKPFAAVILGDA